MNAKKLAAEKAVEFIEDGMIVGLGTGSTAYYAIQKIAERINTGLRIQAVATSRQSEEMARQTGIPIIPFSDVNLIDIDIDGADEVDKNFNLIKGGGGALLREKIIACNSKRFIVVVDQSKLVDTLGKFPLPVEIVPFAFELTMKKLQNLDCDIQIRQKEGKIFITDNGNYIVDCSFGEIADPAKLNSLIHLIPGVVETGLFVHGMVSSVIVGSDSGVKVL